MANNNHNNNNRKKENSHNNHYNRFRGRNRHRDNYENKEVLEEVEVRESNRENRERRENRDVRENREHRENRNNRDNQVINTFTLGTKELEDKTAEFQYDKGWYSIIDILGEEKNVIYKSKNAQEAYTKWNVYIGRKKDRSQKVEKAE